MQFNDTVYGSFSIEYPVLVELIESEPLQRLKGISQAGYAEPFFPGTYYSRFEHSVGVCYLLSKFGATLSEQVAGLLHDVSHTAFSHCVDYALEEGSETLHTFQDDVFETFVRRSSIPKILNKYNFDIEFLFDDSYLPLLERPLPELCADRIDYILRTGVHYGEIDKEMVCQFLSQLKIINHQWVFENSVFARRFAEYFLRVSTRCYSNIESAVMCRCVGDMLKHSLRSSYITRTDLFQNDDYVIQKIVPHLRDDPELQLYWNRMNNKVKVGIDPDNFDALVMCKSRVVDPLCLECEKVRRLSDCQPDWKKVVTDNSEPKIYYLKFEE
jgi:hypothetical protein